MRRALSLAALVALLFLGPGCTAAMPLQSTDHLSIHWRPSIEKAKVDCREQEKPLLVLLIAGSKSGFC